LQLIGKLVNDFSETRTLFDMDRSHMAGWLREICALISKGTFQQLETYGAFGCHQLC